MFKIKAKNTFGNRHLIKVKCIRYFNSLGQENLNSVAANNEEVIDSKIHINQSPVTNKSAENKEQVNNVDIQTDFSQSFILTNKGLENVASKNTGVISNINEINIIGQNEQVCDTSNNYIINTNVTNNINRLTTESNEKSNSPNSDQSSFNIIESSDESINILKKINEEDKKLLPLQSINLNDITFVTPSYKKCNVCQGSVILNNDEFMKIFQNGQFTENGFFS